MKRLVLRGLCAALAAGALSAPQAWAQAPAQSQGPAKTPAPGQSLAQAPASGKDALRVCADPHSLPQSNDHGEGYRTR